MISSSPQATIGLLFLALVALAGVLAGCQPPAEPPPQRQESSVRPAWKLVWNGSYAQDIQPIFDRHCVSCHGPDQAQSQLRLTSHAEVMAGGQHGPVITPGNPRTSVLITSVDGTATGSSRMPPTGPRLSETEVQNLVVWVDAGAPAD